MARFKQRLLLHVSAYAVPVSWDTYMAATFVSSLPSAPPRPDIHDLVLAALVPAVHDQIPVKPGTGDAAVVRPDAHSLSVLKGHFVLLPALPCQDAVLLADPADLPPVMYAWEFRAWHGVVQTPRHDESPAGIVVSRDLALVRHGLAAEGERAGVDEGFCGTVGAAIGVDFYRLVSLSPTGTSTPQNSPEATSATTLMAISSAFISDASLACVASCCISSVGLPPVSTEQHHPLPTLPEQV